MRPIIKLKVGLPIQSERSALPVKTLHTCQTCIYREASVSLYHTTHLLILKRQAAIYQLERGIRVAHLLERTICIGLSYLLTLYWQFMIRKFLLVTGLRQRLLRFSYALQLANVPELEPDVIPDI